MSRSYRKTPVLSDQQIGGPRVRMEKRLANKAVRAADDVPSGKAYRKYSNSWDICDYKFFDERGRRK